MPTLGSGEHDGELAEGVFHLISAHEVVPERWRLHPVYVALCGAPVQAGSVEGTECPNECDHELVGSLVSCLACLRAAIRENRLAGVDGDEGSVVGAGGR
jgi:hypothetical protein